MPDYSIPVKQLNSHVDARLITTVGPHTVAAADHVLLVSYNGATQLNLPASPRIGKTYVVTDSGGYCSATNTITIDCNGAELINGGANYVLMSPYESATLVSLGAGSGWSVL